MSEIYHAPCPICNAPMGAKEYVCGLCLCHMQDGPLGQLDLAQRELVDAQRCHDAVCKRLRSANERVRQCWQMLYLKKSGMAEFERVKACAKVAP